MEELAKIQSRNGELIQRIISNFQKDPQDRKTNKHYFEERLQRLEDAWASFEEVDTQIRALPAPPLDHPYFVKEYYEEISIVYQKYKEIFLQQIKGFETQIPKGMDTVSKSLPQQGIEIPKPIKMPQPLQEQDSEIKRIMRRQKGVIESLRRQLDGITIQDVAEYTHQYYEIKLQTIRQLWSQIEGHNYYIWELCDEPNKEGYNTTEYADLEEEVQQCLVQLSTKLEKSARTPLQYNINSSLKLPKINLVKFDGDYTKWRQFSDLFKQMIHNQEMGDCQKMWYLKANVTGEAEKLVRHLSLSNENYSAAWKMLEDRYENKRLLAAALINRLLAQPSHSADASAAAIRNLHDTTHECLLGLENMGIPIQNWDPLLLHILVKKLDKSTHILYEQTLENPRELQTIKGFLTFLQNRFQSLEALGGKARQGDEYQKRQQTVRTLTSVASLPSCVSCKGNHPLFGCKSFLKLSPSNRLKLLQRHKLCINCLKPGHYATGCTLRGCTKCLKKHNSLVHLDETNRGESKRLHTPKEDVQTQRSERQTAENLPSEQPVTLATLSNQKYRSIVLLSTARIRLVATNGKSVECRAILDSGSQINIATDKIIKKLGVKSTSHIMHIQGIGKGREESRKRVSLKMESLVNGFSQQLEAHVLSKIIPPQPTDKFDTSRWPIPNNIKLADPSFNQPSNIDLLIGAEFYHQLLSVGQIKLADDLPILQNTQLGWIVSGRISELPLQEAVCGICNEEENLDKSIEKFWQLEEVDTSSPQHTSAERKCEIYFTQTTRRTESGRFIVSLPFSDDPTQFGESKDVALRRFFSLERRLAKNYELKTQYVEFMKEYRSLGHMEEVNVDNIVSPYYFVPHHSVLKPDSSSTKLRVVFDASTKTSSNISLNDILYAGPRVQDDLFTILLRFRLPRYVFTADIQKMYRQIMLQPNDRKFHLIYWRDDPSQPLKCYQLCTVTYGTTSAPYLATRCLQQLADEGTEKYPLGSQVLRQDFYVDDVMTGSDSIFTATEMQKQLMSILKEAGFKLRKWCGNHPRLLQNIPAEDQEIELDFSKDHEEKIKTLGLTWLPKTDNFSVKTNWAEQQRVTKRIIASEIARLFDPLGILAPVIVSAKILLQHLWQLKIDWDAALPQEFHTRWTEFRDNLRTLDNIRFPRHIFAHEISKRNQIHTFADASERAYGAAVYIRSVTKHGQIIVRLLCAKSRVAPIKKITVPRLELCAAKLAADLTKRIKADLKMADTVTYLWSDSEVVLSWINSQSSAYETFVANRIAAIHESTVPQQWRHVGSKDNPADVLSRGLSPRKLETCHLWFYGPKFLHGNESIWPAPFIKRKECELERKRVALPITGPNEPETVTDMFHDIHHNNSFRKIQRIFAYILRFIRNTRSPECHSTTQRSLSVEELDDALYLMVKLMQREHFKDEIQQLQGHKKITKGSLLSTLTPFIDERNILRVGGRLEASNLLYDAKHPMLLPYSHPWTKLLMIDLHKENRHIGPQALHAITRQRFWPIKGKTIARSVVQHCIRCARASPKMLNQIMGDLPSTRVQPARPFINSGVDFCGPLWIHYKIRGKKPTKCYVALFCCFSTKAVHLELVSDLTTDAFIGALKRFISRRGRCKTIYCDNATNFIGARNRLEEAQESITSTCSSRGIEFHFIPPRAPHFGGLWEAAVKSAKHLLQRSTSSAALTYEELETVIVEIEAILNSRPLTPMSADPNDLTALTPGHFLIGEPLNSTVDTNARPLKTSLLTRWELVSHLKHEFWRRWSQEYLSELQQRSKWKQQCPNIEPGAMVLIQEDNTPVLRWPLGRIIHTYKGDDGYVRVADVRTASGVLRRPIHRLALLPVQEDPPKDNSCIAESNETAESSHLKRQLKPVDNGINDATTINNQESSTGQIPRKRAKTRVSLGSSIMTVLLTCFVLPVIHSSPIEINQFDANPGIHFDNMGQLNLISTEWSIVVYYDLQPYWTEFDTFSKGIEALQHLCSQIRQKSSCRLIVQQFQHIQEELTTDNELLSTKKRSERTKRGAFNIVGNVANSLFGLLDSNYAKEMSETIKNVKENEEYLLNVLRNHTSIVDSTLNIIKNEEVATEQRFESINNQTTQIINRMNDYETEVHQTKLLQIFTSLSIQLTLISTNLRRIQLAIYDVAADTHHGKISPQLLSPHQLRRELARIKNNLLPVYRLPANQEDILQFYALMTVKSRIIDNHVIFRLILPLLSIEGFDLFSLISIPVLVNDTLVAIKPSSPYLAVTSHRDRYYMLTDTELSNCKVVPEENYICTQLRPIYQRGASFSRCEMDLLNHVTPPRECKTEQIENSPVWIQLTHTNQWIYALKIETATNVVCGSEVFSVVLKGSGLLKLSPDCVIKQDWITIQGHRIFPSQTRASYTKLGSAMNITTSGELRPLIQEVASYKVHVKQIENLQQQLTSQDLLSLPNGLKTHTIHSLTVSYLGFISIICVIAVLIFKHCLGHCTCGRWAPTPQQQPPQNQPEEEDFTVHI